MFPPNSLTNTKTHQGNVASFYLANPYRPNTNEDACAFININDNTDVLIIADGAGGLPNAKEASSLAIETVTNALSLPRSHDDLHRAIVAAIDQANNSLISLGTGCGTTLSVVTVATKKFTHYLIGDSSAICTGQRGKLKYQSIGHGPVSIAEEAGIISEEEALFHEDRHLLNNLLGDAEMFTTISQPKILDKYDRLLVASDGIWDNFYLKEIIEIIRKGNITHCATLLAEQALQRMQGVDDGLPSKPDDISFLLYQLN